MRKIKFLSAFVVLALLLGIGAAAGGAARAGTAIEPSRWLTYTDPRYGFSIDYPADWKVTPRDDQEGSYGGAVTFNFASDGSNLVQVAVGLRTVEREPNQDLADWTAMYQRLSSVFAPSEVKIEETRMRVVSGRVALTIRGTSPLTFFQFTNVPHGRTVWFIWTNADESLTAVYLHMVDSFRLSDRTPTTLAEAFGPVFHPLPRKQQAEPQEQVGITGVVPLPSGWKVPTPAGTTYSVLCGSQKHTGKAAYATDIQVSNGTGVYAAHRSWVDFAGWSDPGYGILIKASTDFLYPDCYTSYYAHLQSVSVSAGQEIATSARIAYSDNTGTTTGPHLHFHVQTAYDAVDLRNLYVFDENSLYPSGSGVCGYMYR